MLVEGYVEFGSCRVLDAALLDVLGHSDHRMPGVIARANRRTEVWPQTLPDRVLSFPDPVRQRFIDHDHLALRRDVGPFETAAGDDRDAHGLEIIAHDELVVVDDLNGPSIGGGVVDRKSTRLNSSHANISYAVFCLKKKKRRWNPSQRETHKKYRPLCQWRGFSAPNPPRNPLPAPRCAEHSARPYPPHQPLCRLPLI